MFPTLSKKRKLAEGPQFRIFELELFPSTSRHYPRFNYEEICSSLEMGTGSTKIQPEADEEFRDRDADEIVRRLEEKYGTNIMQMSSTTGPKKSKKNKKIHKFAPEDVMDKGLGYIQEDDFIDDAEAYDEWVPTTMDTAKHGHYVNKGPLEFRQLDFLSTSSSGSRESDSSTTQENQSTSGEEVENQELELEKQK